MTYAGGFTRLEIGLSITPHSVTPLVVPYEVDDAGGMNLSLISALNEACDAVEDAAPFGVLELRLRGSTQTRPAWPGSTDVDTLHKWEKAIRRLDRLPGVTLVVAAGRCGRGAVDFLAAADHRIAAPSLELDLRGECEGSWPSTAMYRVAARSGQSLARRLFMFAAKVNASQAIAFGLADVVSDDTDQARDHFVRSLAGLDLQSMASRRMLLSEGQILGYERVVGLHVAACDAELRRQRRRDADDIPVNRERISDA